MPSNMSAAGKAVQQSLFDDIPIESSGDTAIVRVGRSDTDDMSPLQKKFNAQARRIERLRLEIDETTKAYDGLLNYWAKHLAPVKSDVARLQMRLALDLETQANGFKLGVRQRVMVGGIILELLDNAFSQNAPEKEAQDLFSRWNDIHFDDEIKNMENDITDSLRDMIRDEFGIDLDPAIILEGPEAVQRYLEKALLDGKADSGRKPRKKTVKQAEKEERERQAQEAERKSIRSLYLSLAKVLHPDTELDASSKAEKETLMKEVTAAYESGDLHTLLRIESEWIDRESSTFKLLPDEKLKLYIAALKEQAESLEGELSFLDFSPRYAPIQSYLDDDLELGKRMIDSDVREEKSRIRVLEKLLVFFSRKLEKKVFIDRIRELAEE